MTGINRFNLFTAACNRFSLALKFHTQDNNFSKMKKTIFTAIIAVLTLQNAFQATAAVLGDIAGSPYSVAISELQEMGAVSGYEDGTFRPNNQINRAEFLKIVMSAFTQLPETGSNCFSDVHDEWFARYVCSAKNIGIVTGYPDGSFKPGDNVNYAEALAMIYRTNEDEGEQTEDSAWYTPYLKDAEQNYIGLEGMAPSQKMKRGEIAGLTWNYYQNKKMGVTLHPSTPVVADNSSGNQIFVAENGDDGKADGTINNPFKNINAALAAAAEGDTIVLRNGTYSGEVRIRKPNMTIKSMDGEWAVIKADLPSGGNEDSGVNFDVDSSGGKLQRVEVVGGFYGVTTQTRWDWGDPADRAGASNIIIEDSKIHDTGHDAIKIKPNSDNITIRNSEIYNSGKVLSPDDCNAEGIDNVNGDNMLVQGNYIHDICSNGVYAKGGAANAVIENNRIENTGGAGILLGFDTSPEYFDLEVNPDYYESINSVARNNLVVNARNAGIGMYASKNAQVYNNTIVSSSSVYHSPIYFGITFQDWDSIARRPAHINPKIYINVVKQPSSFDSPFVGIRYSNELSGLSALDGGVSMSGNCYYKEGGSASFEDNRPQSVLESANLAQWKAHIGSDADSLETDPGLDSSNIAQSTSCKGKGYNPGN